MIAVRISVWRPLVVSGGVVWGNGINEVKGIGEKSLRDIGNVGWKREEENTDADLELRLKSVRAYSKIQASSLTASG